MTPPRRQLGLWVVAAIVVANMIGTGVFTSTGFQAADLKDPPTILLCWVIGGIIALCGASAYAELGSMMPKAGGEYVYLREAYHPVVGFMSGWVSLTAGFSAPIAVSAMAFSKYTGKLFPALGGADWITVDGGGYELFHFGPGQAVAIALILMITLLHVFDTKVGGWVQAGFTAAKVVLIVVFIFGGLIVGTGSFDNLSSRAGGFDNMATKSFAISLMYVSFAYSGWNAAAYIASDIKDPQRNLPRALMLGTGAVMALYVMLNIVFFYAAPPDKLAGVFEVGDYAAKNLFGERAGQMVTGMISLALVSSVSAMVMAGPRVYAAMANDRALPKKLAFHNKRGVPTFAVIVQGGLGILFVIAADPDQLLRFVGFSLAIFAALTVSALFVMRRRGLPSPYRAFGYPVTPVLFIGMSAWIAYAQIDKNPLEALIGGGGVVLSGLAFYLLRGKQPPSDPAIVEEPRVDVPEARVVSDAPKA